MKNIIILAILSLCIFYSCSDCVTNELGSPLDCPDIQANIGDPCDDGNPDTQNDVINSNCQCAGEVIDICLGNVLTLSTTLVDQKIEGVSLDISDKQKGQELDFNELTEIISPNFDNLFLFPFSTSNASTKEYIYNFIDVSGIEETTFLRTSTDGSFGPTLTTLNQTTVAPVFFKDEVYTIDVITNEPNTAEFSILKIDPVNGQTSVLISAAINTQTIFVDPVITSISDDSRIYFLGGDNLIVFNPTSLALEHILLNTNTNPDFDKDFLFGLEYSETDDKLIAIKSTHEGAESYEFNLISIDPNANFEQSNLLNLSNDLKTEVLEDGGYILLTSTTIDQCENEYYLTQLTNVEVPETEIINIDLDDLSIDKSTHQKFHLGIEVIEEE